jgi:hypothetical protein
MLVFLYEIHLNENLRIQTILEVKIQKEEIEKRKSRKKILVKSITLSIIK